MGIAEWRLSGRIPLCPSQVARPTSYPDDRVPGDEQSPGAVARSMAAKEDKGAGPRLACSCSRYRSSGRLRIAFEGAKRPCSQIVRDRITCIESVPTDTAAMHSPYRRYRAVVRRPRAMMKRRQPRRALGKAHLNALRSGAASASLNRSRNDILAHSAARL